MAATDGRRKVSPTTTPSTALYWGFGAGAGIVVGGVVYGFRRSVKTGMQADAAEARRAAAAATAVAASQAQPIVQKVKTVEDQLPLSMRRIPNTNETLFKFGIRALGYGTLLSVTGCAILFGGIAWALDVKSLPEFGTAMRQWVPSQRTKIENVLVPVFDSFVYNNVKPAKPSTPSDNQDSK